MHKQSQNFWIYLDNPKVLGYNLIKLLKRYKIPCGLKPNLILFIITNLNYNIICFSPSIANLKARRYIKNSRPMKMGAIKENIKLPVDLMGESGRKKQITFYGENQY